MSSGGKKKNGQTPAVPTYHVGVHFILGHGPWDKITEVYVDKRLAWRGDEVHGTQSINKEKLFGGYTREGGVIGDFDVMSGLPAQGVNSYLSSIIGVGIPAFRGVESVVLKQMYVGLNYYFKAWSFKGQRIHTRKSGAPQWNDGTAEVVEPHYTASLAGTINGNETNTTDPITTSFLVVGETNADVVVPGYKIYIGDELMVILDKTDNLITVQRGASGTDITGHNIGSSISGLPVKLINAVHVIRECLTDNSFGGLGFSEALMHPATFEGAAYKCLDEGLGFSWYWNPDSGNISDFITDILAHIQATLYFNRTDSMFHLDLIRPIDDTSSLIHMNDSNIKEVISFSRLSINKLINTVTVKFINITTDVEDTVTVDDKSLIYRQGKVNEHTENFSGVVTHKVATLLAQRLLAQLSFPAYLVEFTCNRDAEGLQIGSAFKWYQERFCAQEIIFRVVSINLGSNLSRLITINAVQDTFQNISTTYVPLPPSSWVDPVSIPIMVPYRMVMEAPYYMVARAKGDTFASSVSTTSSYSLVAAVSPTSDSIAANIWTTTGAVFKKKSTVDFCASGLLAFSIGKTDTTIFLNSTTDLELLSIGNFIQLGTELIGVTNISGSVLTVIRGVCDTVPQSHIAGDRMYAWEDFSGGDQVEYVIGETVKTKLTTMTAKGELPLNKAPEDDITLIGRMHRPYPPGNLKINGDYWPVSKPNAALTITWATRNRFQETADLIDYYTGDITSEDSVTYSGSIIRTDTLAVLSSFSFLAGTSIVLTPSYAGQVKLSVWSENDNGNSFQKVEHTFTLT